MTARARLIGLAASALLWIASALPAFAQTPPGWSYGFVPTPAQWNAAFANKQDYLGSAPCLVTGCFYIGPIVTLAPTTIGAGVNFPPGTAPTSPNNGDFWSTSAGFFARVNGVTIGPLSGATASSFARTSPITVSFPAGVVTYGFDFTVANTFLVGQTSQGATTTQPGWYVQITGDSVPRIHLGTTTGDVATMSFGSGSATRDAFIQRVGAANLRFGGPDLASAVAQTVSVQNVLAGTSNTAGAAWTLAGSRGTGTGAGGNLLFQIAPSGSSGSAQNALSTALTIFGADAGLSTGAATDQGAGTLNLAGSLFNNGTGPTGTGGYVRATSPTLASATISNPTLTTTISLSGLPSSGTCANGLLVTAGGAVFLGACPGSSVSVQLGVTTVTGGTPTVGNCLSVATGPLLGQLACARLDLADQTITGGANVTSQSLSSGSITVDCGTRPLQFITGQTSAWSITAPSNDGSCVIFLTNPGATVNIPTFTGFTVSANTGEPLTTTASQKFFITIMRINGTSTYFVKALQ